MTYLRTLILIIALAGCVGPTTVTAQQMCGDRENIVRKLDSFYGETQIGIGTSDVTLVELWASREPPYTWTILRTYTSGVSCVIAVGENGYWKDNDPLPAIPKETPT